MALGLDRDEKASFNFPMNGFTGRLKAWSRLVGRERQRQLLDDVDDSAEVLGSVAVGLAPTVTVPPAGPAAAEVGVRRRPVEPAVPRVLDDLDGVRHWPAVLA